MICPGCKKDAGVNKNGKKRIWHNECYRKQARIDMGNFFNRRRKNIQVSA